jgi:predicted MFS family arabinose efflux permease
MAGYATYAIARGWPLVFVGLLGIMAWKSGAFPVTFAVIGDSLPRERRAIAFSVQSILVRVPRVIGAPIGGLLIASLGIIGGVRTALLVTLVLALGVLAVQRYGYREDHDVARHDDSAGMRAIFASMRPSLKRLIVVPTLYLRYARHAAGS